MYSKQCVISCMLFQVSWGDDQSKLHFSNLSSIVIEDLFPNTHYQITAQVIGTELTDTLNESTDPLGIYTVIEKQAVHVLYIVYIHRYHHSYICYCINSIKHPY